MKKKWQFSPNNVMYQIIQILYYLISVLDESKDAENDATKTKKKSRWGVDNITEELVNCLEGFSLAKHSTSLLQKRFDPPEIPKGMYCMFNIG